MAGVRGLAIQLQLEEECCTGHLIRSEGNDWRPLRSPNCIYKRNNDHCVYYMILVHLIHFEPGNCRLCRLILLTCVFSCTSSGLAGACTGRHDIRFLSAALQVSGFPNGRQCLCVISVTFALESYHDIHPYGPEICRHHLTPHS